MSPDFESMDNYLERSLSALEPHKPPKSCCDRIRLHGHADSRIDGNYALAPETVDGRVLYKQDDEYILKEEACFIYYNETDYCVGSDPTKSCSNDRLLASNQEFLLCPQDIAEFEEFNTGVTIDCVYENKGLTDSIALATVLEDPLKIHVVRYFDDTTPSIRQNAVFNEVYDHVNVDPLYENVELHQIDCELNDDEAAFCLDQGLEEIPDILVYRGGEIVGYYTQTHDLADFKYENFLTFLDDVNTLDPVKVEKTFPETNVTSCCPAVLVAGDQIGNSFGFYFRSTETKYGHVHYKNPKNGFELFFNQLEFQIGNPYSDIPGYSKY